jgi:UDP:flavonoid glycosyltransferase YjiC (YdhE family)
MSRITLAWEHGEGYGHANRLRPIALALRDRGHEVSFVVCRLRESEKVLAGHGFPLIQAPMFWRGGQAPLKKTPTFAAILIGHGYASPDTLRPLHLGWQDTLSLLRTDLVLCDHSPTALLAARTLGIPRTILGGGFESPPRVTPLPEMLPWNPSSPGELVALEGRALSTINAVLTDAGHRPITSLADLFAADADFLCTFPEIDHYGPRDDGLYCGPIIGSFGDAEPIWPDVEGRRVFVYIKRSDWDFDSIMAGLAGLRVPSLVHAGGMGEADADKLSSETVRVSARPFDFRQVLAQSDLVVGSGGHGTVVSTLLAGRPLLLTPQHPEQRLLAERVVGLGAGLIAGYRRGRKHDYVGPARQLLDDPSFTQNAQAFARRHADFDAGRTVSVIVDRMEAVLRGQADAAAPS